LLSVLSTVLAHGYSLLSPIDYGKEEDGRVAIVFSKPYSSVNHSATSLPGKVTFAVSFPDKSTLRVINPPLHSTPAILQALRSAWPRGTSSENKVESGSYEFKLKGYSILKEDTFPRDSLIHILNILSSLDNAGFTLLASLSIAGIHHRIKDLWIFAGKDHLSPSASANDIATSQNVVMPVPVVSSSQHQPGLWDSYVTRPEEDKQATASQEQKSDEAPNGLTKSLSKGHKPAVLRKKNHPQDSSQAKSDDDQVDDTALVDSPAIDMTGVGARQYDSVSKHSETPARVLYSTPHPQTINADEPQRDPNLALGDSAGGTQTHGGQLAAGLGAATGAALLMGAGEGASEHSPHKEADHSQSGEVDKPSENQPEIAPSTAAKGSSPNGQPAVDHPNGELLGAGVFRDTGYTSSLEHQQSSSSVPQVESYLPHPLIPVDAKEQMDSTSEKGLKHPLAAQRPAEMKRQDTPIVPGGWLSTPAEEKEPVAVEKAHLADSTPDTQNVPNLRPQASQSDGDRKSEVGILGTTLPSESPNAPETSGLDDHNAVGKSDEQGIPSSKKVLEQEESKIPSAMDHQREEGVQPSRYDSEDLGGATGVGGEQKRDDTDSPGDRNVTPKRSVFKKIFHRQGRGSPSSEF